ncbi:hypothetical protein BG006_001254 [Podila minutissima]|uniref:[histone H3]-trimethyl-L-lysine(4) demethylase n=1 Tax=Podila minutissima TaxID=64525 RepID=A0A9P5VP44_9FUNG|nr:hypothetical protein BG006_001254 [Podila minutissima]
MMKQSKLKAKQKSGQKAPALDMASVSTKAPPENPVSNPPTRIFGLQDAPCYYPTEKEFMEPLRFIESIRPEAEKAGICKIIPPEGWKPTFALDTEVQLSLIELQGYVIDRMNFKDLFRFKTRIQKLNSMEGETRTNINYLDQLYKFHRQQGHPVLKIPQLDKRPIDLFRLKKEVAARGGYQKVTAGKKWAEIGRGLDYTRKQCTSLSNALKSAYVKVILPYEVYLSKQAKNSPDTPADAKIEPSDDPVTHRKQPSPSTSTSTSTSSSTSKAAVGTRKSKRIKKDPVSYADSEPSSPSYSERMSSEPCEKKETSVDPDLDVCEICQTENDLEMMLICDGCELGYHTYCLTPPLTQIPKTDWYCAKCLVAGDDFGFEEGEEYSLSSFQQKCSSFKTQWFEKQGYKDGKVPEDAVEREFWKLVEDAYESAQVEYGADLHSTQHGSGFPSLERHPNDKYSTHPANLNNMPVLPESLFCHIKSDISGMMIPWLYVGMCFSTFCWHNEDHYTYSINYMHWGDTKTWYGIPASDALKFENTMKQAVPELFEQQPDLLFQLVTMLSPERLVANGVKVLALDQRPGQFVVTFPQAYHAGFNHGFNFAEAVNFAPPDWCQFGLECVKRYKEHKKQPVFSHDELIITTALDDTSIATAQWLHEELDNLLDRELSCRRSVQKQYPQISVATVESDRPEEEVQCQYCNAYIYLSQIVCKCSSKVVCHEHFDELCDCEIKDKTLRLRYSDDCLKDLANRVSDTAAIPGTWTNKFRRIMMETRVPSLKTLRSLLSEADKIPFIFREAAHLREFVAKANDWVEAATKLMIRKHHQGRRVLERTQGSTGKRLEDLQGMLDQAERLRFDCPEIKQLQESIETMQEFQMEARRALDRPAYNLHECRELQEAGLSMNISMDEIDQLDTIVTDLSWVERAITKGVITKGVHMGDYHLICSLVTDAEKTGVSPSNTLLMELVKKRQAGQDWEASALAVLNKDSVDLDRLQSVIDSGKDIAVPRAVLSKAETLYNKVIEWEKTAAHLLKKANDPLYSERPNISELKRAVRLADSIPTQLEHKEYFEGQAKKFDEWFSRTYQLFNPGDVKRAGPALDETLEDLQANVGACTADENFDKGAPSMSRPATEKTVLRTDTANGEASGRVPIEGPQTDETKEADQSQENSSMPEGSQPQTSLATDCTTTMDVDEDQIYCLCRTAESGMMVECDECHEWYHGTCVRVTKREASSKSNYICPVCNLSIVLRRDNHRPSLGQLAAAYMEGHSLHFSTVNVPVLGGIVAQATKFMEKVDRFLLRESIALADIKQVKGYLRKVEGLDVDLVREREALRNHILRLIPSSMPAGGVQFSNFPSAPPLSTINTQLSSRASERIQAAREQAELKKRRRKSSKDSIDLGNGPSADTEEKKRRVYKKRDPSDGDNKPRRRKSSGGQSFVSTDSNTSTPSQPQTPFASAPGAKAGSGTGTGDAGAMGTGQDRGLSSSPASGSTAHAHELNIHPTLSRTLVLCSTHHHRGLCLRTSTANLLAPRMRLCAVALIPIQDNTKDIQGRKQLIMQPSTQARVLVRHRVAQTTLDILDILDSTRFIRTIQTSTRVSMPTLRLLPIDLDNSRRHLIQAMLQFNTLSHIHLTTQRLQLILRIHIRVRMVQAMVIHTRLRTSIRLLNGTAIQAPFLPTTLHLLCERQRNWPPSKGILHVNVLTQGLLRLTMTAHLMLEQVLANLLRHHHHGCRPRPHRRRLRPHLR